MRARLFVRYSALVGLMVMGSTLGCGGCDCDCDCDDTRRRPPVTECDCDDGRACCGEGVVCCGAEQVCVEGMCQACMVPDDPGQSADACEEAFGAQGRVYCVQRAAPGEATCEVCSPEGASCGADRFCRLPSALAEPGQMGLTRYVCAETCQGDAECAGDRPYCDADGDGKCKACIVDGHCEAGHVCRGNVCVAMMPPGVCDVTSCLAMDPARPVCSDGQACEPCEASVACEQVFEELGRPEAADVGAQCVLDEPGSAVDDEVVGRCLPCHPVTDAGCAAPTPICVLGEQPGPAGGVVPTATCAVCDPSTARGCPAGDVCLDGQCVACGEGAPCAGGQRCDGGRCVECVDDADCGGATPVCLQGNVCGCTGHADCGVDELCCDGACVPTSTAACTGCGQGCDADLANGCDARACVCGAGPACSPGAFCQGGACVDCRNDPDCPANDFCVNGVCLACQPGTLNGCDGNLADDCDAGGTCTCGAGPACPAGEFCQGGSCVDCRNDADCPGAGGGAFCVAGACVACDPGTHNGCDEAGPAPICDVNGVCRACAAEPIDECDARAGVRDVCLDDGTCQACEPGTHRGCDPAVGPICEDGPGGAACRPCADTGECLDGLACVDGACVRCGPEPEGPGCGERRICRAGAGDEPSRCIPATVVDAMEMDGRFVVYLNLLDRAALTEELRRPLPITLFPPIGDAFSVVSDPCVVLIQRHTRAFVLHHVGRGLGALAGEDFDVAFAAPGRTIPMQSGENATFVSADGVRTVNGLVLAEAPLISGNGTIFPLAEGVLYPQVMAACAD